MAINFLSKRKSWFEDFFILSLGIILIFTWNFRLRFLITYICTNEGNRKVGYFCVIYPKPNIYNDAFVKSLNLKIKLTWRKLIWSFKSFRFNFGFFFMFWVVYLFVCFTIFGIHWVSFRFIGNHFVSISSSYLQVLVRRT